RELEVLQGIGEQAVVASICPANTRPEDKANAADWGYRPAIESLLARLRTKLQGQCFNRQLNVNPEDNSVPCVVIEAFNKVPGQDCGDCEDPKGPANRSKPEDDTLTEEMKSYDCRCEIAQLDGADRKSCQTDDPYQGKSSGWCYVDPDQGG